MKELCLDFINTRWYLTHRLNKEILADSKLLMGFLQTRQLHVDTVTSSEMIEGLLEMRAFLAKVLEDFLRENAISSEAVKKINYYLKIAPCVRAMEQGVDGVRLKLQPLLFDWKWVMAEIAASFAELIEHGDKKRIRICENPDCKWFFYDETKNRTKRWCDDKCASLMKVRKYRAKQKSVSQHYDEAGES